MAARKDPKTGLTPKQEKFCQNIIQGMNQTEAFRHSYKSDNILEKTMNEKSSRLMREDKIKTRINDLTNRIENKVIKSFVKTKEDLLNELEYIKERALKEGDLSEARQGIVEQCKILGFYVDKKEIKHVNEFAKLINLIQNEEIVGEIEDNYNQNLLKID